MNTPLKVLLLIPLTLLTNCATGPKLPPEMETLRLSLNRRMANTSSKTFSSGSDFHNGQISESVNEITENHTTSIRSNGDVTINLTETTRSGPNKNSLSHQSTTFVTVKLEASQFGLQSNGRFQVIASVADAVVNPKLYWSGVASARQTNEYVANLFGRDFVKVKERIEPSYLSGGREEIYPIFSMMPIAANRDKTFIQGIVRDMNRFIELYRALPK